MVDSSFVCPVTSPYVITQTYEEHLEYAAEHPEQPYNGGIDLYSRDLRIFAAFNGFVDKISYQERGYGNYIKVQHVWGYSLYAHLSRVQVNVGDIVKAGQEIAQMGNTGFSSGTHLHFELRDMTEKVLDPSYYFQRTEEETLHDLVTVLPDVGGNLRRLPLGDYLTTIPKGTVGKIISGPVYKNGLPIYQVEFPVTGWMAVRDHYGNDILGEYGA